MGEYDILAPPRIARKRYADLHAEAAPPTRAPSFVDGRRACRLHGCLRCGQRQPSLRLLALLRRTVRPRRRSGRRADAHRDAGRGADRPRTVSGRPGAGLWRARLRHQPRPGRRSDRRGRGHSRGRAREPHGCLLRTPRCRRAACGSRVRRARRRGRCSLPDQADQGLGRTREDQQQLRALLAGAGDRRPECHRRS